MAMLIEFTQLITADGVVYPLEGIVERALISGPSNTGMPPIEYATQQGPYQHGETVISYRLQPRIVQLVYRRNACNRAEYWNLRDELVNVVRPNRQEDGNVPEPLVLRGIRPDGVIRDLDVLIDSGPEFERASNVWDEWSIQEGLRLIAHNPAFYDPTTVHITPTFVSNTELSFPAGFPISFGASRDTYTEAHEYEGNWLALPIITITGPSNYVSIANTTTDEEVQFAYPLVADQQCIIDLRFGRKRAYDPSKDPTDPDYNLIGGLSGDAGTFHFECAPKVTGGINNIEVYFSTPLFFGSVDIEYNTRYLNN